MSVLTPVAGGELILHALAQAGCLAEPELLEAAGGCDSQIHAGGACVTPERKALSETMTEQGQQNFTKTTETESTRSINMAYREPCKECLRRLHPFLVGIIKY